MTSRVLPIAEWDRLAETGLDLATWRQVDPHTLQVVIVEDEGRIVACWATMACRHVEGFWLHPDHRRRGGALRRLFVGMRTLLRELGATTVITQAQADDVHQLLTAAGGVPIAGTSFLLPVDFGPWATREKVPCP